MRWIDFITGQHHHVCLNLFKISSDPRLVTQWICADRKVESEAKSALSIKDSGSQLPHTFTICVFLDLTQYVLLTTS